jgi:hypothetical protein
MYLQGEWSEFDGALLDCAPSGSTFIMHHESDPETQRMIIERMRSDLRLSDGSKKGLFRNPTAYVVEQDVPLTDVTGKRFDFGTWWDVAVASDRGMLLDAMGKGANPQGVLHDGSIADKLSFLLFRNFHVDEVSIRTFDIAAADRVFDLAAHHRIPMMKVTELDFYEGSFDLPPGGIRIDRSGITRS